MYSLIAGMLIPLRSGITDVQPSSVRTGERVELTVTGYNTHFLQAKDQIRAWLKLDSVHTFSPRSIDVQGEQQLTLSFDIPAALPTDQKVNLSALILDNPIDGASVLPSAVSITQNADKSITKGEAAWPQSDIKNLHKGSLAFPFRNLLEETIRNLYYHVSLWFAMIFLLCAANYHAYRYLRTSDLLHDAKSAAYTQVALLFGIMGLVTGMMWASYTWGAAWSNDPKQAGTAVALLIYAAYFVLRGSFDDEERRAKVSAPYSVFAFVAYLLLIYLYPRLVESLHPGNGGNPGFGGEDLDNTMRLIFYPAIIGWILLGFWLSNLAWRITWVRTKLYELESY
ncbi:MAG: cytochrome c biogenesis protein CcsA [Bacteroidota bacterium]